MYLDVNQNDIFFSFRLRNEYDEVDRLVFGYQDRFGDGLGRYSIIFN